MILNPSLILNEKKRTLKFHFDMMHGDGNLKKAVRLLDIKDRDDFNEFINTEVSFNPHNMFICKNKDILKNYYDALFPWLERCEKEFGFDKPPLERFLNMLWDYMRFDFGESYFRSISVVDLVIEKMPVSITLGLWSTLLAYLVSIPLGIKKAVTDGSDFDTWTSGVIILAYAIPGFLFAILLLVLFAGGSYWQIFPLRGLSLSASNTLRFFLPALFCEL